jgi:predicted ATPase
MLAAVLPSADGIAEALEHLVATGIVKCEGSPPDAVYMFKHALVQDVAVANLLRSKRQALHVRIAQTLETHFPDTALTEPELLARHYMSGKLSDPAIGYCLKAAERALQRSATAEAIDHLQTGLELLETLGAGPGRDQRELELATRLGAAQTAAKGFAAPEVRAAYARARSICERVEEPEAVFSVLRGLWVYHLVRAQWRSAQEVSEQMLAVGERDDNAGYRLEGHRALGMTLLWLGNLRRAREHVELGLDLYDPERHHRHAVLYGNDPGVACLAHDAYVLWMLGYPDRALARSQEAEMLARRLRHPFSLSQSLIYRAFVHKLRREVSEALHHAEEALALASEHGFPFWLAEARLVQGWARTEQGDTATGLAMVKQGLSEFEATGAQMDRPRWQSVLAEVLRRAGRSDEALVVVAKALAVVEVTGERLYEAKLRGLMGDLLLEQADPGKAEECERSLLHALSVARNQDARSWELRVASSLARLWGGQGRVQEAVNVIASVYDWFTEGFAVPELRTAKELLSRLRSS